MATKRIVFLLAAVIAASVAGCGTSNLLSGRRELTTTERSAVRMLPAANPETAQQTREQLASTSGSRFADAIREGQVVQHMSPSDVLRSWGEPDQSRRPWYGQATDEYWFYLIGDGGEIRLYFRDGAVIGAQSYREAISSELPTGTYGWKKERPSPPPPPSSG